jgi:hypothetical protein
MLITDIDKFIDEQFNLLRDYKFNKPIKKNVSDFVTYYEKTVHNINYSKIYDLVTEDKNKKKITLLIEKYILFYLILRICLKEDEEDVDSKNNEKIFIEKLFNISNSLPMLDSIMISELVDIYLSFYTTGTLLKLLKEKDMASLPQNDSTKEIINIFNDIGTEQVLSFMDVKKKEGIHNILVTLLFRKLYIKSDKTEISIILEKSSIQDAEFKYITIVEARIKETDFASLEALFDIDNRKKGIPDDYYNLIDEFKVVTLGDIEENLNPEYAIQSNLLSDDRKIAYLFHKKILIPITDEILRYNVGTEKYSDNTSESKEVDKGSFKTDTKLNYIVNKVNLITESARNSETKKLFYQPLFYRQAIPSNDIEEMKIIKKFADIGRVNAENVSSFTDLLSFRVYPYINFHLLHLLLQIKSRLYVN